MRDLLVKTDALILLLLPIVVVDHKQAKHSLDKLLGGLLTDLLREKPADPLQFIIDSLSLGPEHAAQVSGYQG